MSARGGVRKGAQARLVEFVRQGSLPTVLPWRKVWR